MPIYVYEREDGTTFEVIQKMSDEPLQACPDTGQKVARQISASMAIFKGSGFYQTDYCSSNKSASKTTSSEKTSESKSESTSTVEKPKACGTGCGCH